MNPTKLAKFRIRCAAAGLLLLAPLLVPATANASTTVGSFVVGTAGRYDYSPTVIENGQTQDFWWCGDTAAHTTDTILHEQIGLSGSPHVTVPEQAVLQETAGAWDSVYTCNPDVVEGEFADPLGNGVTYTYAMYYVGTNQSGGTDNSIGAAFSNDGQTWVKDPTPVVAYPISGNADYGYGQPNVYNAGGSAVTMLYEKTTSTGGTVHLEATSTDGVHFTTTGTISTTGLPSPTPSWGGAAYDEQDGRWYAAFNDPLRPASTTGAGTPERGQPGVTLYAISDLVGGTWTELDTVDTNATGYEANFIAGLLRQPDGGLYAPLLPSVEMYLSTSNPRPATTASPADAADTATFNSWDIAWSEWTPGAPLRPLPRYYSSTLRAHEVTTGWVDTSTFHVESVLGDLYEAPTGAATVPWYACKAGTQDWFVSLDSGCEGQLYLGLEGYGYAQAGTGEVALYRCYTGTDHFVSTDSGCEGKTTESLLGYAETAS